MTGPPVKARRALLEAALNGARRRDEHPALPMTSLELAEAAAQAVAVGAMAIHVHARDTQPDFASVNFDEPGAELLAALLLAKGVGVEAGLSTGEAADRLARSGLANRCLRALLEPQAQDLPTALETVHEIESNLTRGAIMLRRLLHGVDRTAWPMIAEAAARGYGTRVGFEDTLTLPDGSMAESNAILVQAACRVLAGR